MGKTLSIALILILTLSSAMLVLPLIHAQVAGVGGAATYSATPARGANGLWNIPSFAGITCAPNPVGVGQSLQIIMLIEQLPPSQGTEAETGTTGGWPGLILTITDPNGNTTTQGPFLTDVSGTYQISYTPTMTGTYTFQFSWPGLTVGNGPGMIQGTSSFVWYWGNFLGATSNKQTVTVTQTPAPGYTEAPVPLPNQYWQVTNVNGQNRAWNTICGPYVQSNYNATGNYNPYTYPVMAPHILWTQQPYPMSALSGGQPDGGLAGGAYGSLGLNGMNSGASGFSLACIMDGFAYYNGPTQNNVTVDYTSTSPTIQTENVNTPISYFYCMNIQTGQIIWSQQGSITCGQLLNQRAQQSKSVNPYLWSIGGTYKLYSASTGALMMQWGSLAKGATIYTSTAIGMGSAVPGTTITPVAVTPTTGVLVEEPPHPTIVGEDVGFAAGGGALLEYIYGHNTGATTGYLMCWNSSLAIDSIGNDPTGMPGTGGFTMGFPSITAQIYKTPLDWNWGIMWNVSVPLVSTTGTTSSGGLTSSLAGWSLIGCDGQYAVFQSGASSANATGYEYRALAAMNVATIPETTTWTIDVGGTTIHPTTGTLAWVENYSIPMDDETYTGGASLLSGGNIIVPDSPLLTLWDFNDATGALKWADTPFNNDFSFQSIGTGIYANGIVYNPGYDGYMHAINATTGTQIWDTISVPGGTEMPQPAYPMTGAIAAGAPGNVVIYASTTKSYEAQPLYRGHELLAYNGATGKQIWNISGEFSLICTADGILIGSNKYDNTYYAFGVGQSATTVMAPLTSTTAGNSMIIQGTVTDQTPGLLKGTPAISDPWMGQWMAYMYMDQAKPTSATGVTVSIDAIDPNGNFVHLGNATSDITGNYNLAWAPPSVPGKYTIIATFGGSNSYCSSVAETATYVSSAAPPAASPTATPTSVADTYFVPAIAGLFVLIIVVAIVLALLMLRKRP